MESDRASIDMLLKVKSKAFMIAKVDTTDVGIASALINVVRIFLKKMRTAKIAKKPPYIKWCCTSP